MIIQIWHSRDFDYISDLYSPLKNHVIFSENDFLLPHDGISMNSRETLKSVDLFICEVSYPSLWLGIEIWFASMYNKRIVCFHENDINPTSSLNYVTNEIYSYSSSVELLDKIQALIKA